MSMPVRAWNSLRDQPWASRSLRIWRPKCVEALLPLLSAMRTDDFTKLDDQEFLRRARISWEAWQ